MLKLKQFLESEAPVTGSGNMAGHATPFKKKPLKRKQDDVKEEVTVYTNAQSTELV